MAREKLNWQNVRADANVGTGAFVSGSKMLAGALDNMRAPLDRANQITADNAASERDANTGALMTAINNGENPELSGAYDSKQIADAQFSYKKYAANEARRVAAEGRAQAAAGRAAQSHRASMNRQNAINTSDAAERSAFLKRNDPITGVPGETPIQPTEAPVQPVGLDPTASRAIAESDFSANAGTVAPESYLNAPIGEPGVVPVDANSAPVEVTPMGNQPASAFAPMEQPQAAIPAPVEAVPEISNEEAYVNESMNDGGVGADMTSNALIEKDAIESRHTQGQKNLDRMARGRSSMSTIKKTEDKIVSGYNKDSTANRRNIVAAKQYNQKLKNSKAKRVKELEGNRKLFSSAAKRLEGGSYTAENAETGPQQEIVSLEQDVQKILGGKVITAQDRETGGKLIDRISALREKENASVQSQLDAQYGFTTTDKDTGKTVNLSPEESKYTEGVKDLENKKAGLLKEFEGETSQAKYKELADKANEESGYNETSEFGRGVRDIANTVGQAVTLPGNYLFNAIDDVGDLFRGKKGAEASDAKQDREVQAVKDYFSQPKEHKKVTPAMLRKKETDKINSEISAVSERLRQAKITREAKDIKNNKAIKSGNETDIAGMIDKIRSGVDQMAVNIPGGVSEKQKAKFVTRQLTAHLKNSKATKAERAKVAAVRKKFDYELKKKTAAANQKASFNNMLKN